MKYILHIATIISIITYLFWVQLPKGSFYVGNGIFIFLLCVYIFLQERNNFIKFILFSLSLNNLLDELFFNPTQIGVNEISLLLIVPLIWYLKSRKNV